MMAWPRAQSPIRFVKYANPSLALGSAKATCPPAPSCPKESGVRYHSQSEGIMTPAPHDWYGGGPGIQAAPTLRGARRSSAVASLMSRVPLVVVTAADQMRARPDAVATPLTPARALRYKRDSWMNCSGGARKLEAR